MVSFPVISSVYSLSKKVFPAGVKKFIDATEIVCIASLFAVPKDNLVLGITLHSKLAYITKSSCLTCLSDATPFSSTSLFGSTIIMLL